MVARRSAQLLCALTLTALALCASPVVAAPKDLGPGKVVELTKDDLEMFASG